MGFFDSSSSSSNTQKQSNQTLAEQAQGFSYGDVTGGSTVAVTNQSTDYGSVGKSLDVASTAIDKGFSLAGDVTSSNQNFLSKILDTLTGTQAKQQDFNQQVLSDAISFARDSTSAGNVATTRANDKNLLLAISAISLFGLYAWMKK